jgi:DNA-binding HxlR family transcriptional regulator
MGLVELRLRVGLPESTLRSRLSILVDAGVVTRRKGPRQPGKAAEYQLSRAGMDLLPVVGVLERWLATAPDGGLPLDGPSTKMAITALCEGWSGTLLRALAAKPLPVVDLDHLITELSYPSLERRIAAMRFSGQVEARPAAGRETPYAVTNWLRHAVAPLLAAIRWERLQMDGATGGAPPGRIDFEAALLLAMPLLDLDDAGDSGRCRLAIELGRGSNGDGRLAGALVEVRNGSVRACTARLDGDADAWAYGPVGGWLDALVDGDLSALELGGSGSLARTVVAGLNQSLFESSSRVSRRIPHSR